MARTAVRGRLTWQAATVDLGDQGDGLGGHHRAGVPDWPGHRAGQHLDVRLTAEDGYTAERSYSIASAPGEPVAITVERLDDGEVSPYLTEELRAGRRAGAARPDRRLVRVGARRRRAAAAARRRIGRRSAAVDPAAPPAHRQRRPGAAAVLRPQLAGRHLPRRA